MDFLCYAVPTILTENSLSWGFERPTRHFDSDFFTPRGSPSENCEEKDLSKKHCSN
jgi:hypothetical protein